MKKLFVIIPSIKNEGAFPSIRSALAQRGFDEVVVIIAGKSACSHELKELCRDYDSVFFDDYYADKILPGKARNRGLDLASEKLGISSDDYVLFLDDDITVPESFSEELKSFLEMFYRSVAVMGRVESRPANYWTRIIDYSNFWWLQVRYHIHNLGWLGAGATLIRFSDIGTTRFKEDMSVGEDTDFFMRIAREKSRLLSIDALATCEHYHGRESLSDVINYQYRNGLMHTDWYSDGFSLRHFLRQFLGASKTAVFANKRFLVFRPHILLGVIFCFFVCFLGTQAGSIKNKKGKIN